jgi:hypothetical protein
MARSDSFALDLHMSRKAIGLPAGLQGPVGPTGLRDPRQVLSLEEDFPLDDSAGRRDEAHH